MRSWSWSWSWSYQFFRSLAHVMPLIVHIAYSITYTDNGDTFFGNGDTISSSDTDPAFDYTSEYYYSSGDVYKVTFSSDGTGGYNITVSSSPEDTTSCGAGAGAGAGLQFFRS